MPDPTRFRHTVRLSTTAGTGVAIYTPAGGKVLNVRELTVSTDTAGEVVVHYGTKDADRLVAGYTIAGLFLPVNGGASPALDCLGAWSPAPGLPIRLYPSATGIVWVELAGVVED